MHKKYYFTSRIMPSILVGLLYFVIFLHILNVCNGMIHNKDDSINADSTQINNITDDNNNNIADNNDNNNINLAVRNSTDIGISDNDNGIVNSDVATMLSPTQKRKRERPTKKMPIVYQHVDKKNFFNAVQQVTGGGPWPKYGNANLLHSLQMKRMLIDGLMAQLQHNGGGPSTYHCAKKPILTLQPAGPSSSYHAQPPAVDDEEFLMPKAKQQFRPNTIYGGAPAAGEQGTLESLVWPYNSSKKQMLEDQQVDEERHYLNDYHSLNLSSPKMKQLVPMPSALFDGSPINYFNPVDYLYTFNDAQVDDIKTSQDQFKSVALQVEKNSVLQVRQVLDVCLFCLGIFAPQMDQLLEHIRHGHSIPEQILDKKILQTFDPEKAISCLKMRLLQNELMKNNRVLWAKIAVIRAEIRPLFGQTALFANETSSSDKLAENQPPVKHHSVDEQRIILLFFYSRLFRKLTGLLDAPFNGIQNHDNTEKSERLALVHWLVFSGAQIMDEFMLHLKKQFEQQNAREKINFAQHFYLLDAVTESIDLAQLVIEATIAPLIGHHQQQKSFPLDKLKFVTLLHQIQSQKIVCLISNKIELSLAQILTVGSNLMQQQQTLSVVNNFSTIFLDAIQQAAAAEQRQQQDENGAAATTKQQKRRMPNAIQNAKFYLNIYRTVSSTYLHQEHRAIASSMPNFLHMWDQVNNFLAQSAMQLEALISAWHIAKSHPFCDEELEKQAINKYIKEHCPLLNVQEQQQQQQQHIIPS